MTKTTEIAKKTNECIIKVNGHKGKKGFSSNSSFQSICDVPAAANENEIWKHEIFLFVFKF